MSSKIAKKTYCKFSEFLKDSLSNCIDADFGLLEQLASVLTDRQYQSLLRCNGYERSDKLMEIVHLLPQDDFLRALNETDQHHVVNFFYQTIAEHEYGIVFDSYTSFF